MTDLGFPRSTLLVFLGLALLASGCGGRAQEDAPVAERAAAVTEQAAVATAPAELLPNGSEPSPGVLTGGQPTTEQLQSARSAGYGTVIDLRLPEEGGLTRAEVESLGLRYVSIPVKGGPDLSPEKAAQLARALDEAEGKTIVHCRSGNRVGALFAMKAYHVDGMSPEEALAVGKSAGLTRLETYVKSQLGLEAIPD